MKEINGLEIKAFNSGGVEIKIFEIIKINGFYYGICEMENTDRELLELKAGEEND